MLFLQPRRSISAAAIRNLLQERLWGGGPGLSKKTKDSSWLDMSYFITMILKVNKISGWSSTGRGTAGRRKECNPLGNFMKKWLLGPTVAYGQMVENTAEFKGSYRLGIVESQRLESWVLKVAENTALISCFLVSAVGGESLHRLDTKRGFLNIYIRLKKIIRVNGQFHILIKTYSQCKTNKQTKTKAHNKTSDSTCLKIKARSGQTLPSRSNLSVSHCLSANSQILFYFAFCH